MFARGLKELNELKHVMKPDDRLNYPVFIPEDFKVLTDDGLLQEAVTDNDSFSRDGSEVEEQVSGYAGWGLRRG